MNVIERIIHIFPKKFEQRQPLLAAEAKKIIDELTGLSGHRRVLVKTAYWITDDFAVVNQRPHNEIREVRILKDDEVTEIRPPYDIEEVHRTETGLSAYNYTDIVEISTFLYDVTRTNRLFNAAITEQLLVQNGLGQAIPYGLRYLRHLSREYHAENRSHVAPRRR